MVVSVLFLKFNLLVLNEMLVESTFLSPKVEPVTINLGFQFPKIKIKILLREVPRFVLGFSAMYI